MLLWGPDSPAPLQPIREEKRYPEYKDKGMIRVFQTRREVEVEGRGRQGKEEMRGAYTNGSFRKLEGPRGGHKVSWEFEWEAS